MENARKSLYLIVMTLSEVHIQRVYFEPEAPVIIDLVMPNARKNMETCNAKRVYSKPHCSRALSLIQRLFGMMIRPYPCL